ncbi:ClpXP protease specificity-enhancing factor [Tahibacter caeni]|uniref:ClpXP protease specificity-enhancing factor n=1 Tax=Tahibacter caeni TaxID=1453545 RepID=UPI0021482A3B|nr:ClpXP protease specificity-enhancing factor [Tahibacter caeni]
MSSNRPYLVRAIHEWISDNNLTPYLLVDAAWPGVVVPPQAAKDGRVVLNIAPRAVAGLELGKDWIRFNARFGGVSHRVEVPVGAVLAIYAQENGQGMMFPAEDAPPSPPPTTAGSDSEAPAKKGGHLRVIK